MRERIEVIGGLILGVTVGIFLVSAVFDNLNKCGRLFWCGLYEMLTCAGCNVIHVPENGHCPENFHRQPGLFVLKGENIPGCVREGTGSVLSIDVLRPGESCCTLVIEAKP